MTETYARLVADLQDLRQRWRLQVLVTGLFLAGAVVAAALLLTIGTDNLLRPGTAGRLLLSLVFWGSAAAGLLVLVVRRWLEHRRDDYFAALVERRHPELHNLLLNALQLGRGGQPGSPRLVEAIVKDASIATADLDLADALDFRPLKQAAAWLAGGLVLVALYAAILAPRFVNGLGRVLLPTARIAPYTATRFVEGTLKPGDARVPEGATVRIEAAVEGVVPDSARLYRRAAGKDWQALPMSAEAGGSHVFAVTVPGTTASFDYYLAAGDGRTALHRLEVVPRPKIEQLTVRYELPAYTAQPARESVDTGGEIAAIAGTTVTLDLRVNKPLREATLVTESEAGQVIAAEKVSTAMPTNVWRAQFVVWSKDAHDAAGTAGPRLLPPTRYHVRLLDTDGYESAEPLWRPINLLKDQPPTVVIAAPGRDVQVPPEATVNLALEAKDDYGVGPLQVLYRVNDAGTPQVLAEFPAAGAPAPLVRQTVAWKLAEAGLKPGDLVQYWAAVADRNNITGPGRAESRRFSIFIVAPQQVGPKLEVAMGDFAQVLEELVRLQRENRAQTASAMAFATLVTRQVQVRATSGKLARAMEQGAVPLQSMVQSLDNLIAGPMAEAVRLLESGRDSREADRAASFRQQSLPVQDAIIAELQALLARLQRNEQARKELRKLEKTDKAAHAKITEALTAMIKDLDRMSVEEKELAGKFEKLPKRLLDASTEETKDALSSLDVLQKKWSDWAEGKVDELAKLPTGFVDDFGLRSDVKKIYEEVETAAKRKKAENVDVAVEDIADPFGKGIPTRMKEDLEVWLPDTPDYARWLLEEPYVKMDMPEMPLPNALEDLVGDLMQEEEEFDQEADDITSAWGANMDLSGWLAVDGNWSSFGAQGKTGNDLPNSNELAGRSGDGRRGKSSGQMVGDTSRALPGRKTPARVTNERYEPGKLKQEGQDDPAGATGGGKKAGAGVRGLQGGSPPDFVRDMERLSAKQAMIREKAEKVAQRLEAVGVSSRRLTESIQLMRSIENDYRDLRYDDAARRRRVALSRLEDAVSEGRDQATGVALSRARQLPAAMREEMLQASDEGYPPGYEELMKSYFRALSEAEK